MKATLGALPNGSSLLRRSLEHGWRAAAKICYSQQTRVALSLPVPVLEQVTREVSRGQQHHENLPHIFLSQAFGQLFPNVMAERHMPLLQPSTSSLQQPFSAESHTRPCIRPIETHHFPRVGSNGARLCHQHYSKPASRQRDSLSEAAAWVSQVLPSGNMNEASRKVVVNLFTSLAKMLHSMKSTEQRLQRDASIEQQEEKTVPTHVKLPVAMVALFERAVSLATSWEVPVCERIHPPVALLYISTALHAASPVLQHQLMLDEASSKAGQALILILRRCTDRREFHREPRFVSMTCRSLVLLHEAGICNDAVRMCQAKYLGSMRTDSVKLLDLQSVLDLCALIAAFRAGPGQRRPRTWYICLARLEELVAREGLSLPDAGKIARSAATMQGTLQPWLQNSITEAGVQFAEPQSAQKKKSQARDVVQYLVGTSEMHLPISKDVVQEMFLWTIGRHSECSPQMIVEMLVALQRMQLHSRHQKHWRKVRVFVRHASLDDLQKFCRAAQDQNAFLDASVVEEIAKATSTAAAEKSKDASKASLIRHTLHRLQSTHQQSPEQGVISASHAQLHKVVTMSSH